MIEYTDEWWATFPKYLFRQDRVRPRSYWDHCLEIGCHASWLEIDPERKIAFLDTDRASDTDNSEPTPLNTGE